MRSADIQPGRFYRVRLHKWGGEWVYDNYVRVENPSAEPRYSGDTATVEATRFQLRGAFTTRFMPRNVIEETFPDAKTMRIVQMMEAVESEETLATET